MHKYYIVRDGYFHTDWEVNSLFVFDSKKAVHTYMKNIMGFRCYKSKNPAYGEDEDIYENKKEEFGYEILEVELWK